MKPNELDLVELIGEVLDAAALGALAELSVAAELVQAEAQAAAQTVEG